MRYLPEDLASSSTVPALRPALPAKGLMSAALSFLENVRYRAMTSDADFEFLADWRWNHFRATSLRDRQKTRDQFIDGLDRVPTARTIGVYLADRLVASIRTHSLEGPLADMRTVPVGGDIVAEHLRRGFRFVIASRWISDPALATNQALTVATTRLTCMAAAWHRADHLLSVSRESHARAYARMQNAKVWTATPVEFKEYEHRYHLIASDYAEFRERMPTDRQAYLSSDAERRALFSEGADCARKVVPSAGLVARGLAAYGD